MAKNNKRKKTYSIELFGRCIWETRYHRWGQLSYSYTDTTLKYPGITNSFCSIVWFERDWRAYRMWPYLSYSGDRPIRYRRLSAKQTIGIYAIAVCTSARHFIYRAIPKTIRSAKYVVVRAIKRFNL